MKKDDNPIKQNLEDKFKKLLPAKDAPADLKREVFQTLDTLEFFGNLVDLFTTKFTQTEAVFLGMIQEGGGEDEKREKGENDSDGG